MIYNHDEVMIMVATANKRVQVNVDQRTASEAEDIINELGLTPTTVINALYKKIASTGKIPFNFKLTKRQMVDLKIREISRHVPVKKIRTQKELKEFFNAD